MRYEDLERWRKEADLTISAACDAIGISPRIWAGFREARASKANLPAYIGYACFCVYHKHEQWDRPTAEPEPRPRRRISAASLANLKRGRT